MIPHGLGRLRLGTAAVMSHSSVHSPDCIQHACGVYREERVVLAAPPLVQTDRGTAALLRGRSQGCPLIVSRGHLAHAAFLARSRLADGRIVGGIVEWPVVLQKKLGLWVQIKAGLLGVYWKLGAVLATVHNAAHLHSL